jgi:deoxyribonuclease-4
MSSLRLGAHTSIAGGLHRALERGAESGCDVVQIFTRSNQQWAMTRISELDIAAWRRARRATRVEPAMVHGSYLVNLAASTRKLRERSFRAVVSEIARCDRLGIPYLVMHPGAHTGDGERIGVRRIARGLARALARTRGCPTAILLENTAGQGSNLGYRFSQLRDVIGAIAEVDAERVGVCIDTCHTLAAGYDISTDDAWQTTFEEFERILGCRWIRAFHVNDSKLPRGSRVDRHEHLGRGFVGLHAFRSLVNDPRFRSLPMVIETPKPTEWADAVNVGILRALAGRSRVTEIARRLAALPLDRPPPSPSG